MTTKNHPLVSIYIPTHNRLTLLQRAIKSALIQTYKNIELIIVDDNSDDGTKEYLAALTETNDKIRFHVNSKNLGACASRNIAINMSKGEFITGIDDDDYILNNHIETLVNAWYGAKVCISAVYPGSLIKISEHKTVKVSKPKKMTEKDLLKANQIGSQIFTSREYFNEIGGYDENLRAWQDIECWYRLLKESKTEAIYSGHTTYFVDQSHEFERISTNKSKAVNEAFQYFSTKHRLSKHEKNMLSNQKIPYGIEKLNAHGFVALLTAAPRLNNFKILFNYLLTSIKISVKDIIK